MQFTLGPMKGVIRTPDIAKIFHPTPDIKAKKCPTPTLKIHPDTRHPPSKRWKDTKYSSYTKSTLDTVIFKSTPETVKYLISTLDTDPPLARALTLNNLPSNFLHHKILGNTHVYHNQLCFIMTQVWSILFENGRDEKNHARFSFSFSVKMQNSEVWDHQEQKGMVQWKWLPMLSLKQLC